jgi:hypothetical protein
VMPAALAADGAAEPVPASAAPPAPPAPSPYTQGG